MNKWIIRGLLAGATTLLVAQAYTYSTGPLPSRTGAPNDDGTCNAPGCHSGNPLNAPGGSIAISGVPPQYVPGATYTIGVQVAKPGQRRWGFELSVQTADGMRGGEITVADDTNTQLAEVPESDTAPEYIEHTFGGTALGQQDVGPTWTFSWTAPAHGTGPVTFYAAGNAANGDLINTGDFIYTTSVASSEGSIAPSPIAGDINGDGKVNVQDTILALQCAVGITHPTDAQVAAADVAPAPGIGSKAGQKFGDGKINVSDAIRILQRAVGLISDF